MRKNVATVIECDRVLPPLKPIPTFNSDREVVAKTRYFLRKTTIGVYVFVVLPSIWQKTLLPLPNALGLYFLKTKHNIQL